MPRPLNHRLCPVAIILSALSSPQSCSSPLAGIECSLLRSTLITVNRLATLASMQSQHPTSSWSCTACPSQSHTINEPMQTDRLQQRCSLGTASWEDSQAKMALEVGSALFKIFVQINFKYINILPFGKCYITYS